MGLLMLNGVAYSGFTEPATIYSDEEREIGVWIDGRPLYQKVITFSLTSNSPSKRWYNMADVSSLSINHLVTCVLYNNYQPWYEYYSVVSDGYLRIYSANDSWSADMALIQYTKTTDVAGSGTWTTQGGYAHHYSTNEKVIGTWIDGKPLYEKTILINNPSAGDWVSANHNIANIEKIRKVDASYYRNVNGATSPITTWEEGNYYVLANANRTAINYFIKGYGAGEIWVTLQYTKTTD